MSRTISSWKTLPWTMLLALALFVRAAVPQGYMVEESASGGIEIALCNSDTTLIIPLAEPETGHDQESDHSGSACYFGGHSEAGDAPIAPVLALPNIRRAAFAPDRIMRLSLRQMRPIPPATGPPFTA